MTITMLVPTKADIKSASFKSPQLCHRFTFSEIQLATQNLDDSLVIGRGGFGKVYKGTITITNGPDILTAAIKRLDSTSNQGASEFWAEINMFSNLRHCHLVSLIGYCNDEQEMILVYEYMSHGSLEDHLHKRQTPLSWVQRLMICIGAARGLDYLHTGTGIKHGVVHRDVKSSNILLDESWEAKISDFGLSKMCPRNQHTTYINTGFKGTFGYVDPDYFYTGKLTRKSDVYAFGVLLFEVLCGKQAVDSSIVQEHWNLAVWAQESIKEGRLKQIVDTDIRGVISPKCLKLFTELAKRCLHKNPKQRPTMAEVVASLESVLALQAKANNTLQPTTSMRFFAKKTPKVIFPSNNIIVISNDVIVSSNDDKPGGQNQTLYQFAFYIISVATESFSETNRIPQLDAYNCFYKGKLQNGQIIVVSKTGKDFKYDSFIDESSNLVKLEHENLAKLLGYCIEEETNFILLVYEYKMHATLDYLMNDPLRTLLNWDRRYKIILGIARALLYLHRDAPIQIVHGDVKPESIHLDENLNPILSAYINTRYLDISKTSDFLSSWPLGSHYTPPEYIMYATVSIKTDIFSFGVLVLECISGHTMLDPHFTINNVQRNWSGRKLLDMIDPRIDADSNSMTRFVEIGLLCVQENAADRPTMEEVVSMLLDSSSVTLPVSNMRSKDESRVIQ